MADALGSLEKWTTPAIEEALRALAEERELKPKKAFQPIRAAVTGTFVSPPLFESLEILGQGRDPGPAPAQPPSGSFRWYPGALPDDERGPITPGDPEYWGVG